MEITNAKVYDLADSIVASGLPMMANPDSSKMRREADSLEAWIHNPEILEIDGDFKETFGEIIGRHMRRAKSLASCRGGESHDCFLCGITVNCTIKATKKWWEEFQRYHFNDIISASSTMHRAGPIISRENLESMMEDSILGEPELMAFFKRKQEEFEEKGGDKDWLNSLRFCLPLGTMQVARITTNYRSLKTMRRQRKSHRLQEWRDFCKWIETLPLAEDLILGGQAESND